MLRLISTAASLLVALFLAIAPAAAQSRVALVIGNGAYTGAAALKTPTADADLMTTTLKAAGFDVTEANDLTGATIGKQFADFIEKVKAAGPSSVVFVYFSGYGAQYNGDSYLLPIDAQIAQADDVQNVALSLTDITKALAAVPSAARIIVLDGARDGQFGNAAGSPVAPGLALVGVPPGFLLAYPAAPGADVCPCEKNDANSPYVSSLATLLRQPGLDISQVFDGVRLQINQASGGAQIPWMVSALNVSVKLFAATAEAKTLLPACGVANIPVPPLVPRKITRASYRRFSADEAYRIAMERDSLEYYQWFVEDFPRYRLTGQIWHIMKRRREAILWHRVLMVGTTAAYWNYVSEYPDGVYMHEARFWLRARHLPPPPRSYTPVAIDLPPDYADEATGLAYVVARGQTVRTSLFGHVQTVYADETSRWTPPQVTIIVRPPPPPPPPTLIEKKVVVIERPIVQPVQPVSQYTAGASEQRTREIQQWHETLTRQQETIAKQYHVGVVAPASVTSLNADVPSSRIGSQILKKSPPAAHPAISNVTPNQPVKPILDSKKPSEPVKPTISNVTPNQPVKPILDSKKPSEPVKPTISNVTPNQPVKPILDSKKPSEPVKPTISNVTPNQPVKPAISNVTPNQPVKPILDSKKPSEPVKPTISNVTPNRPVKPTISNVAPNQPVKPTISNVTPNRPVKPAISSVKPNQPVKPTISNVTPNQPVKPTISNVAPNQPVKPTIGNVKPNEPVKPAISSVKPNQPVKPTIGNARPNEPVKPTIGNARPNEPVKPMIRHALPDEPVKPTIGNARPNQPMKPTIGNVKPNEPVKPTLGNARPNQPVKPTIGNIRPNEPARSTIGHAKPNEPGKPTIGNARPNESTRPMPPRREEHTIARPAQPAPPRREEHAIARPAQPPPPRREEHTIARPAQPAPPRREEHAIARPAQPAPPRREEHTIAKPAQPALQRSAVHPTAAAHAQHPTGCQHTVNGQCVR